MVPSRQLWPKRSFIYKTTFGPDFNTLRDF